MSGYQHCACRDCFELAIGEGEPVLCDECEKAGCDADAMHECHAPHSYGQNEHGEESQGL